MAFPRFGYLLDDISFTSVRPFESVACFLGLFKGHLNLGACFLLKFLGGCQIHGGREGIDSGHSDN